MILRTRMVAASFAMFAVAGSASAFESCFNTGWVSKVNAGIAATARCPEGSYMRGLITTHPNGQNLTYQESFAVQCCTDQSIYPQAQTSLPWTQKLGVVTSQRASTDSLIMGLSFLHQQGQDLVHQESVSSLVSFPINFLDQISNCYSQGWTTQTNQTSQAVCASRNSYVKGVRFHHHNGQNYTHLQSIGVDCCQLRVIGDGGFGREIGTADGDIIRPIQ